MSRGFVKEGDQEEAPIIPPRAALPEGFENYVTPKGYQLLLDEKKDLETERKNRKGESEQELRRAAAIIDGKLALLNERIASARIVDTKEPSVGVRFGNRITIKNKNTNLVQTFQIVGVDEADIKQSKIAFVAPIVQAIMRAKEDDVVDFKLGKEIRRLEIVKIEK